MNDGQTHGISLQNKVEEIGIFYEKLGFTPMAARVLGFLLITDPPYSSFQDIQDFLNASKSSISNALTWLMNDGRVDYMTFSGNRKRYFKINPIKWQEMVKSRLLNWGSADQILTSILDLRKSSNAIDFSKGLKLIIEFETYVQTKMVEAIQDWEDTNS